MQPPGGLAIVMVAVILIATGAVHAQQREKQPQPVTTAPTNEPAPKNLWFVRAGYAPVYVEASSHFVAGDNVARTMTVEIGRQTDGTRDWHRVYNYPSYGVGFYAGRFDHKEELGHPYAAYGFFSWPFPVSNRVQVTSDFGLGVSWNWNEFDPRANPTNTALGSDVAYHVDWGLYLRYVTTARANVYAGLNFNHWSNGATKQPNLGLASIGPKVAVRYNFAPQVTPPRARPEDLPRFDPSWEFLIGGAGSPKETTAATNANIDVVDRRRDGGAFNVTTGIQRHFYRFGKAAAGADVAYDSSTGARVDIVGGQRVESRAPIEGRFSLGVYGGYEHVFARFSILVHYGDTVWRGYEDPDVSRFYQRYGTRFYLSDRFWTTFAVRTVKLRKANFMEVGLGYRFRFTPERLAGTL
jgi:hypothetical protein